MNDNSLNRLKDLKEKLNDEKLSDNERNQLVAEINALMGSSNNSKVNESNNNNVNTLEDKKVKMLVRKNPNIKGYVSNVAVIVSGTIFAVATAAIIALMMIR